MKTKQTNNNNNNNNNSNNSNNNNDNNNNNSFPFCSPIILTLWFRYLQAFIKESCMYFSGQLFFKTSHEILKVQEKSKKNAFSSYLQT